MSSPTAFKLLVSTLPVGKGFLIREGRTLGEGHDFLRLGGGPSMRVTTIYLESGAVRELGLPTPQFRCHVHNGLREIRCVLPLTPVPTFVCADVQMCTIHLEVRSQLKYFSSGAIHLGICCCCF